MVQHKLSDFVNIISVAESDPKNSRYKKYVGLEHYDSGEPEITRFSGTELLSTTVKEFKTNDILIARRNVYLKRAGIVKFEGLTSGDSIVLRVKDSCLSDTGYPKSLIESYLPFVLNSDNFWAYALKHADGTHSKRISKDDVLDYTFSIDSEDKLSILTNKLWAAYKVKESYKKLLAATDEMVKSQFIERFVGKDFPIEQLKDVANITTGSTPSRAIEKYWGGANYWVSAQDMKGKYVNDTEEHLTDLGYSKCTHVPAKSILYVCRGSIGVISINNIECATNQSICTATPKANKCDIEYLYYALYYDNERIKSLGEGTSFKSLSQSTFSNLKVCVPPIDEQKAFVSIVVQADKSKFGGFKSQFIEMFVDKYPPTTLAQCISETFSGEWGQEDESGHGIKVIRTTNFTNSGHLDLSDVVSRQIDATKIQKKSLKQGDILLERSGGTKDNPVGRVVLFEENEPYLFNNFTQLLRPRLEVNSIYLFYSLYYFYNANKATMRSMGSQTTGIQNLDFEKYLNVQVYNADRSMQDKFEYVYRQADKSKYLN